MLWLARSLAKVRGETQPFIGIFLISIFMVLMPYITTLRHGRMHKWLNLDFTRGATVRNGRGSIG